jgi:hypothetical protein
MFKINVPVSTLIMGGRHETLSHCNQLANVLLDRACTHMF